MIEVSFHAFGKAIENLNPWFKSIITTLTERLRKTNLKIKELESNSTIGGYGKGEAEYSFLQNIDVVKILSVIYLCFKSHGESSEQGIQLNRQTLNFYALEIFNCKEAKLEAFLNLLKDLGHMTVERDEQGQPKIYQLHHSQALRNYVIFLQKQRSVVEEKKVQVSTQCEYFLSRILQEGRAQNIEKESAMIDLRPLLNEFKEKKVMVDEDDLVDAIGLGLLGDPQIGDNQALTSEIQFSTLKELYPNLRLVNAIKKLNESKSGKAS